MKDRLTLMFLTREAREAFLKVYRGIGNWFFFPHPNYDGTLETAGNVKFMLHMQRSHVKDIYTLRHDAEVYGAQILS